MKTIIISSVEAFNFYFTEFKNLSRIRSNPDIYHIGLDLEYINKSNFPKSYEKIKGQKDKYKIKICLIQLSNEVMSLIVRVSEMLTMPTNLENVLISSNWIKTGVGIDLDMNYLMSNFNLSGVPFYLDLKTFYSLQGESNPNLENILRKELGEFSKNDSTVKDWSNELDFKSIKYAVEDAYYSYSLAKKFIPGYSDTMVKKLDEFEYEVSDIQENYVNRLQEFFQKKYGFINCINQHKTESGYIISLEFEGQLYENLYKDKKIGKQEFSREMLLILLKK